MSTEEKKTDDVIQCNPRSKEIILQKTDMKFENGLILQSNNTEIYKKDVENFERGLTPVHPNGILMNNNFQPQDIIEALSKHEIHPLQKKFDDIADKFTQALIDIRDGKRNIKGFDRKDLLKSNYFFVHSSDGLVIYTEVNPDTYGRIRGKPILCRYRFYYDKVNGEAAAKAEMFVQYQKNKMSFFIQAFKEDQKRKALSY
jgi:hypothetical protein